MIQITDILGKPLFDASAAQVLTHALRLADQIDGPVTYVDAPKKRFVVVPAAWATATNPRRLFAYGEYIAAYCAELIPKNA